MRSHHQHPEFARPPRSGGYDPFGGRSRRRRDDFPEPGEGSGPDVGDERPGPRGRRGGRPDGAGNPDFGRPSPDGTPEGRGRSGHHGPSGHHDHAGRRDRAGQRGPDEQFDDRFDGRGPRGHHGGPGPRGRGRRGPGGRGPGGRAGRGDIRAAVLLLLAEEPMHGYQIIQEIGERTSGAWRPSPGAIYPALSLLEDEGLVTIAAEGGRKLASLTDAGRAHVTEHADELGTPWQDVAGGTVRPARQLRGALQQVAEALRQVARSGSDAQAAQALALLERTRRDLYLILAGPEAGPDAAPGSEPDVDAPKDAVAPVDADEPQD